MTDALAPVIEGEPDGLRRAVPKAATVMVVLASARRARLDDPCSASFPGAGQ